MGGAGAAWGAELSSQLSISPGRARGEDDSQGESEKEPPGCQLTEVCHTKSQESPPSRQRELGPAPPDSGILPSEGLPGEI